MAYYADLMNPAVMFAANGLVPNQPSYYTNYGAQAPPHNEDPGYATPPPSSYGYYNPNHPSPGGPGSPAHAPYGYSAPPPSYNNGYYDHPFYQAPVRRPSKPRAPSKPKACTRNNIIYRVQGNRVSGNTGHHNGVFNVGNKNSSREVDDHNEEDEEE